MPSNNEMEASSLDDLHTRVIGHIGEFLEADVSYLRPDSKISQSIPGVDSLKLFEMALYLEDCFGVEFEESVIVKLDTIEELSGYIADRSSPA